MHIESQRDFITEPSVAANEKPWVIKEKVNNPTKVDPIHFTVPTPAQKKVQV